MKKLTNYTLWIIIVFLSLSLIIALEKMGELSFENKVLMLELHHFQSESDSLRQIYDSTYVTP